MTLRLLAATTCLFLAGCPAVDFKEFDFTRTKPKTEELVGVWTPTKDTLLDIRERGHYAEAEYYIELRADSSFLFHNIPDWWSDGFGESHGKLETFTGTWDVTEDSNIWKIWNITLSTSKFITSIHLYRQKPPYQLFIRVGDPNQGDAMLFEKKSGENKKWLTGKG